MCWTTWDITLRLPTYQKMKCSKDLCTSMYIFYFSRVFCSTQQCHWFNAGQYYGGRKQCRALGRHESPKVAHFPFTSGAKTCTDCELKSQSHGWEAPDSLNVMNNFTYAYDHNNLELQWRDKANSQVHMYVEYRPQIVHCFPHPQTMSQQSGPFLAASVLGTSVLESHEALSCWGSVGK